MPVQFSAPGVYIVEKNAFPNSVVQVATGVPVFVGYTERAIHGEKAVAGVPTRVSSLLEFETVFGGPDKPNIEIGAGDETTASIDGGQKHLLHPSMRLFFENGGGDCWVVSVGSYEAQPSAEDLLEPIEDGVGTLEKVLEPDLLCFPDAVTLDIDGWAKVANGALDHCGKMQNRFVILDVLGGFKPRNNDPETDVISGSRRGLRPKIQSEHTNFGAAYYPWLNTTVFEHSDITIDRFDADSRKVLAGLLKSEAEALKDPKLKDLASCLSPEDKVSDDDTGKQGDDPQVAPECTPEQAHSAALQSSPVYKEAMDDALKAVNLLPPSGAMAGVYTRTDNSIGVFKAPANTGLASVFTPAVSISQHEQEDLNVPLDGKAVNAIRTFLGRGVLVWGARTLDGNSQDWRYINVRRTLIMLEQSIKYAAEAYVFEPNSAETWVTVQNMISNFLENQWKAGALAGATAADAFSVDVGLGSTMTPNDILDGYMNVTVKVAVVRPAEFIVITFRQKMQTS